MVASSDDEEESFVVYGIPLQEEEESRAGQRRKDLKDPALTKQLPLHQQEVTDSEGRRRFHGAFTGGYSAGYYNTVGSLEGWNPSAFKSSRDERLKQKGQRVEDFMDDDELAEAGISKVQPTAEYDTFGSTAAEMARRQAQAEASARAGGQLSFLPDDIIAPVADSMGIRLLQAMGWRQGKGVGPSRAASDSTSKGRWGPEAGIAAENTPIYALPPKTDTHGLGFDPFKGAEDFRQAKRQKTGDMKTEDEAGKKKRGIAFGTGALEDTDTFGYMDDYTSNDRHNLAAFSYEVDLDEEDADVPGRGQRLDPKFMLPGRAAPLSLQSADQARQKDMIPGFVKAKEVVTPNVFAPPKIPADYHPIHRPSQQPLPASALSELPAKEAQPPEDADLKKTIDAMAPFVARNGAAFEAIAIRQNVRDNRFSFLKGGPGAEYYRWRVQVAKQETQATQAAVRLQKARLTATDRGALLGETALPAGQFSIPTQLAGRPDVSGIAATDKQRLQDTLASTFMQASDQDMGFSSRPQGLQTAKPISTTDAMSQAEPRPSAAAAASSAAAAFLTSIGGRFASGGVIEPEPEGMQKPAEMPAALAPPGPVKRPVRTSQEWRPEPLLCKRFNVPDPFRGRSAPAKNATHFKSEMLQLPDTAAAAEAGFLLGPPPLEALQQLPGPPPIASAVDQGAPMDSKAMADNFLEALQNGTTQPAAQDASAAGVLPPPELPLPPGLDSASAVPYQQKPIDLFKAIFEGSDSEEDDDSDKDIQKEDERADGNNDMDTAEKGRSPGAQGPAQPSEQITMSKGPATAQAEAQHQSSSATGPAAGMAENARQSLSNREPVMPASAAAHSEPTEQKRAGLDAVPARATEEQMLAITKALKDHKRSKKHKKDKDKKKRDKDEDKHGKKHKSKDSKSRHKSRKKTHSDDADSDGTDC